MKPPIEYRRPRAAKAAPKQVWATAEPAKAGALVKVSTSLHQAEIELAHKRAVKAAQMVRYRARQKAAKGEK